MTGALSMGAAVIPTAELELRRLVSKYKFM